MPNLILSKLQAESILQAVAHLNNIGALHEVNIDMFNAKPAKVRVCLFGNRVHVDMFGSSPKFDESERYATQADFAFAYGV